MDEEIIDGSGNVFDDIDIKDAQEMSLKAALAMQMSTTIKRRQLTQRDAGEMLGIPQSHVSRIMNGKLEGMTADRMLRMLLKLGCDIDIAIREKEAAGSGRLAVETSRTRVPAAA